MSLIYVTGIETAGKSTVCKELKQRGLEAFDIDQGIAHYYNKKTGQRSEWLGSAAARTEKWHRENDYMMDRQQVMRFAELSKDTNIYLCGTTQNDHVVLDLFDQVFYLFLDKATLKQRMNKRDKGEFGFAPHEKLAILSWHSSAEDSYRQKGATMVDATLPVDQVVKATINQTI